MSFPIIQSSYHFNCTQCGNCCTGDQKVNLNLYDLYKMAVYKGFNHTRQLFDETLVHLVQGQNNAWVPQIKFKSFKQKAAETSLLFCPFLINELDEENNLKGLCRLHPDKKPLICSLAPVGRILDLKDESEDFVFVKPAPDCPGVNSTKINLLADLKKVLQIELDFERRFYKILNKINEDTTKEFLLENVYSFQTDISFEKILTELEVH